MDSISKFMKSVRKDTIIYLPARLVPAIISLCSLPIYTRFFPPSDFGLYALLMATIGLFSPVFIGWLAHSGLRFYAELASLNREKEFYSTLFFAWAIMICLGVLISKAILLIAKEYLSLQLYSLYNFCIFAFISSSTSNIIFYIIRAKRETKLFMVLKVVYSIVRLSIVVFFVVVLKMGIESMLYSIVLADLLVIVASTLKLREFKFIDFKSFSYNYAKRFLNYGFPIVGVGLFTWVLALSDRYVIQFFRGSVEVGFYSIGYDLSSKILQLPLTVLIMASFPIILDSWNVLGKKATEDLLARIVRYYMLFAIPAFVGITVMSMRLIKILSTMEYAPAHLVVPWVALGTLLQGLSMYTNKCWELTEKTRTILIISLITAFINLALNIVFVPIYGYIAAGITTAFSYGLYLVLSLIISNREIRIRTSIRSILKIVTSSTMMGFILFWFERYISSLFLGTFALVIIGGLIYIVFLIVFNELREELSSIKKLLKN